MSDEIPERRQIVRSTAMTGFLTAMLMVLGLAFWVWSAPEAVDASPVGALNALNPFLALVLEMLIMTGVFVFLTVTVVNLRLYMTQIRSGWTEIILLLVVVFIMTFMMFEPGVTFVTLLLSLAFVVYLYLLQEE